MTVVHGKTAKCFNCGSSEGGPLCKKCQASVVPMVIDWKSPLGMRPATKAEIKKREKQTAKALTILDALGVTNKKGTP